MRYKHDVHSSLVIKRRDAGYSQQDALNESGCRPGTPILQIKSVVSPEINCIREIATVWFA